MMKSRDNENLSKLIPDNSKGKAERTMLYSITNGVVLGRF